MKKTYNVSVIGSGSWGTTLANMLALNDVDTCLYVRNRELFEEIEKSKENKIYLPGIKLSGSLSVVNSSKAAMDFGDIIIISIPVKYLRGALSDIKPFMRDKHVFLSSSKGIENESFFRPSEILIDVLNIKNDRVAAVSGPNFAKEVAKGLPSAAVIASDSKGLSKELQGLLNCQYFRVYSSNDIIGVEIAGALKNVIAIASGISDALNLGYNARASLITRGLAEIARLGTAMGARLETFMGLAGIGDLVLTCTGDLSRNRTLGRRLVEDNNVEKILDSMVMVAEGVNTVKSVFYWSADNKIEMPISDQVYKIIYENKNPKDAALELMGRPLKSEFYRTNS